MMSFTKDIIFEISSYLTAKEVFTFSACNRKYRTIILRSPKIWKHRCIVFNIPWRYLRNVIASYKFIGSIKKYIAYDTARAIGAVLTCTTLGNAAYSYEYTNFARIINSHGHIFACPSCCIKAVLVGSYAEILSCTASFMAVKTCDACSILVCVGRDGKIESSSLNSNLSCLNCNHEGIVCCRCRRLTRTTLCRAIDIIEEKCASCGSIICSKECLKLKCKPQHFTGPLFKTEFAQK